MKEVEDLEIALPECAAEIEAQMRDVMMGISSEWSNLIPIRFRELVTEAIARGAKK